MNNELEGAPGFWDIVQFALPIFAAVTLILVVIVAGILLLAYIASFIADTWRTR